MKKINNQNGICSFIRHWTQSWVWLCPLDKLVRIFNRNLLIEIGPKMTKTRFSGSTIQFAVCICSILLKDRGSEIQWKKHSVSGEIDQIWRLNLINTWTWAEVSHLKCVQMSIGAFFVTLCNYKMYVSYQWISTAMKKILFFIR